MSHASIAFVSDYVTNAVASVSSHFVMDDDDQSRTWLLLQRLVFTIIVLFWSVIPSFMYWNRYIKLYRSGIPFLGSQPEGMSFPFLGHALNCLRYRPWDLMMKWHRVHGPILGFELFGELYVSVSSPILLKQVLQSKISSVKKDVANTYKHFMVILGSGIVTSEEDDWMKQRLKMSMPLRREILEWIPAQTLLAVRRLCETVLDPACDNGSPVPIGSSLRHLTLQVISATFLSLSPEESDSTFARYYLPIVDESNKRVWRPYRAFLVVLPEFWKYLWNVYKLNQFVSGLIRKRWNERRRQSAKLSTGNNNLPIRDILDRVLYIYEMEFPNQEELPEHAVRQFRDEMKTFMLAGHETSAAMMTWAIYELMANQDLRNKLIQEANTVFQGHSYDSDNNDNKNQNIWTAEHLSGLALSEACLKESLRKYSVVPCVARRTIEDLYVSIDETGQSKYLIPTGCSVMIHMQSIHMDPQLWPNPHVFDPTRFLSSQENGQDDASSSSSIQPFTFVPFIAGPRNCLGQHLALLESKIVLSLLLQKYQFSLPKGVSIQVNDWQFGDDQSDPRHRFMVPIIPKEELMAHVAKRQVS